MEYETAVIWFVRALGAYAGIGLLFAVAFVARGIERIDPAARGATLGFRLIVLPASAVLWPLLAWRWLAGAGGPPIESNAHRRAAERRGGAA